MKPRFWIFLLFTFVAGFFVHALFFPQFLPQIKTTSAKNELEKNPAGGNSDAGLYTYINFDGDNFSVPYVAIKTGFYIAITNKSKSKLMWLESENSLLRTNRGYGESERLETILYEKGTFEVYSKLNPDAKLTVVVK